MRAGLRIFFILLAASLAPACSCGKTAPKVTAHPRDVGEACSADGDCKSSLCAVLPGSDGVSRCQAPCPNCAADQRCVQVGASGGQGRFACAPDPKKLCSTCTTDADCGYPGDACLQSGDVKACGQDCTGDGLCPSGYACVAATRVSGGTAQKQCVPESGTCACTEASRGQTRPCEHSNAHGTCHGVEICDPAVGYTGCDALVPADEICDGVDNDCNGLVDDGLGTSTCGHGACQVTINNCQNGQTQTCQPDMSKATVETCNNQDDDCDGVVDNGFDLNTDADNCGQCGRACPRQNGTPSCQNGFCSIACAQGFDDCDHNIVDGCEANLGNDVSNCGLCGNHCSYANGIGACEDGGCALTGCQRGYYDLDQNPADGCEYACSFVSATDLPDVTNFPDGGVGFIDANCDGLDGEVDGGIFVATTGNDSNPGTMALPFRTIQHGVDVAFSSGRSAVYVASGSYTGPITLKDGVGVYGGYLPAGGRWDRSLSAAVTLTGGNPVLRGNGVHDVTVQLLNVVGTPASSPGGSSVAVQFIDSVNVLFDHVNVSGNDGAPGSDGVDGTVGANGGAGQDGQPGFEQSSAWGCQNPNRSQPGGGPKGTNASCPAANGGNGGAAGHDSNWGANGSPSAGGAAFGAGRQNHQGDSWAPAVNNGADGVSASPAADGAPGGSVGAFTVSGLYATADGTDGQDGLPGVGGGGGGGGGGGTDYCDSWGSGGGGGGAGGCGGTAGTHGQGGGASIAVWLQNTNFTSLACSLTAGNGGHGGRGGKGAAGGLGAAGGKGTYSSNNSAGLPYPPGSNDSEQDDGSVGGIGGAGGNGGKGGNAGGGGGGPSIGVFTASGATFSPDGATVVQAGLPGAGGSNAATGAGFNGATGVAQALYP